MRWKISQPQEIQYYIYLIYKKKKKKKEKAEKYFLCLYFKMALLDFVGERIPT